MVQRCGTKICDRLRPGRLFREVRQDVNFAVAVASGLVEGHRDSPREEDLTGIGIAQPHRLLEDLAGLNPPTCPLLAREFPVQRRGVLTNHEECLVTCDPKQETGRAKVAIVDPNVLGTDQLQHLAQERPLLGRV